MPYDPAKARDLLRVARGYASAPTGEYIGELALMLIDAEAEITISRANNAKAVNDRNQAEADRDSALAANRTMREGQTGLTEALETLKVIARNPKGAKQLAAETLAKIGGAK